MLLLSLRSSSPLLLARSHLAAVEGGHVCRVSAMSDAMSEANRVKV